MTLAADGTIASAAVALAAVAPTILSVDGVDEALVGCTSPPRARWLQRSLPNRRRRSAIRRVIAIDGIDRRMAKRAVDAAARRADGESIAVPANRSRYRSSLMTTSYELDVNGSRIPSPPTKDEPPVGDPENVGLTGTKEDARFASAAPAWCCSMARELVQLSAEGAGPPGHHDRGGDEARRCTPSSATCWRQAAAVRVLHARHDHVDKALLERDEHPELDAVRIGLSGNLCRCIGYAKILRPLKPGGRAEHPSSARSPKE